MKELKNIYARCPWWGKILIGGLIVALLWKLTPLWDVLSVFVMLVGVPLLFFVGVGLISRGGYDSFKLAWERAQAIAEEGLHGGKPPVYN